MRNHSFSKVTASAAMFEPDASLIDLPRHVRAHRIGVQTPALPNQDLLSRHSL